MKKGMLYFYDTEADVLYFSKGEPRPDAESEEIGDDVVARLDPKTKEVVGFTILNFSKRFMDRDRPREIPLDATFELMTGS